MGNELIDLRTKNAELQAENAGLELANSKLREYFKEANVRAIVNTRNVQIFHGIETIVAQVRNLEMIPIAAINSIDELLQTINKEATTHGITG